MNINDLTEFFKKATEILPKGAFLTTRNNEKVNTMTIGWGTFGFEWGIPIVEVMIRESRFSNIAADTTLEFKLTCPFEDSMKDALNYCGSRSGRDVDKITECNLTLRPSNKISTPVIACKGLVFECNVIARTEMKIDSTSPEVLDKWYKSGDLHTMYYAKIEDCYIIE